MTVVVNVTVKRRGGDRVMWGLVSRPGDFTAVRLKIEQNQLVRVPE
jgi:hypothetical protein